MAVWEREQAGWSRQILLVWTLSADNGRRCAGRRRGVEGSTEIRSGGA